MPLTSKLVRDFVKARILDDDPSTKGFNYWMKVLPGGEDYPDLAPFQIVEGENLFTIAADEALIQSVSLDVTYPYIILRSRVARSNVFRSTPSAFSGDLVTWIDFYAGFEGTEVPSTSEDMMDVFQDGMIETFNRYDQFWQAQAQELAYNNSIDFFPEDLHAGGPDWVQKNRAIITFNMPSVSPR